jgi:hypothetical protein
MRRPTVLSLPLLLVFLGLTKEFLEKVLHFKLGSFVASDFSFKLWQEETHMTREKFG